MAWKGEVRPDDWIRLDDDPRLHPAAKVRDLKFPPDVLAEHAARPSTRSPNAVVAADGASSAIEAPTVVDVPTDVNKDYTRPRKKPARLPLVSRRCS